MDSIVAEVPVCSHSSPKNTGNTSQSKIKPKKRRKNRRMLWRRRKESRAKPLVHAVEANVLPSTHDLDTEIDDRNLCSYPDADQSPDVKISVQFLDSIGSHKENGASATHTSTSTPTGGQPDLSQMVTGFNEADHSGDSHSSPKNTGNIFQSKIKPKKRRKKRCILGRRRKRSRAKPSVHAIEANALPSTHDLDTEIDDRNLCSYPDADQSPDVKISLQFLDFIGSHKENGASATHTSTSTPTGGQPDLSQMVTGFNEADHSSDVNIKVELLDHSVTREEEGISRQITIKNSDSTISVTIENDTTQPSIPHLKIPTESNIYSRIDEFRVPVIVEVDWSSSSVSSTRTSLLPNVASPVHGPEVLPQFSGVSVNLIDTLLKHLKFCLPLSWYPMSDKEGVSAVLLSSSGLKAVQRVVYVDYEQGSVQIGVHGKPLPDDHDIWNEVGQKFPLCNDNVQAFTNRIVRIVNAVNQLKICTGIEATQRNAKLLCPRSLLQVTFEDNIFGDMNVACYRLNNCSLLISLRRKKCPPCSQLRHIISKCQRRAEAKGFTSDQNCDETEDIKIAPCRITQQDYLSDSASNRQTSTSYFMPLLDALQ